MGVQRTPWDPAAVLSTLACDGEGYYSPRTTRKWGVESVTLMNA